VADFRWCGICRSMLLSGEKIVNYIAFLVNTYSKKHQARWRIVRFVEQKTEASSEWAGCLGRIIVSYKQITLQQVQQKVMVY